MNKIVINHIGKMFITSDCATIMKEMEIVHPAAKMIVLAATMQEQEVGDGSNFVVCLAGELLSRAEGLLKLGLHPSELIAGYKAAGELAVKELENLAVVTATDADMFDHAFLKKAVMAAVGAKQHNDSDFIAGLVADACLCIMPKNRNNFSIDNVRVCKVAGASLLQSEVIKGVGGAGSV
jgi:T-complex protein 1 subunit theta